MVKKIVLTGGPCAGKTTVLSKIEQFLGEKGYKVIIVSESATELINGGLTPFDNNLGMFEFQRVILSYQYYKEEIYNKAIEKLHDDNIVIIYDRGLLDNKAYVNELQFNILLNDFVLDSGSHISELELLSRYDMVIHLVTSASKNGYSLENNKARYENKNEAIILDNKTLNSWIMHDNLYVVDSTDNFEDKINNVLDLVNRCVTDDIKVRKEKKFIVNDIPDKYIIDNYDGVVTDIEQYYIGFDDNCEYRVRKVKYKYSVSYYYVILKNDYCGEKRIILEKKIDEKEFDRLININVISGVKKRRISFVYNGQYYKYDIFSDDSRILEVRLDSRLDTVIVPDCFSVIEDVTKDYNYSNVNIGKKGDILVKKRTNKN